VLRESSGKKNPPTLKKSEKTSPTVTGGVGKIGGEPKTAVRKILCDAGSGGWKGVQQNTQGGKKGASNCRPALGEWDTNVRREEKAVKNRENWNNNTRGLLNIIKDKGEHLLINVSVAPHGLRGKGESIRGGGTEDSKVCSLGVKEGNNRKVLPERAFAHLRKEGTMKKR